MLKVFNLDGFEQIFSCDVGEDENRQFSLKGDVLKSDNISEANFPENWLPAIIEELRFFVQDKFGDIQKFCPEKISAFKDFDFSGATDLSDESIKLLGETASIANQRKEANLTERKQQYFPAKVADLKKADEEDETGQEKPSEAVKPDSVFSVAQQQGRAAST